MIAIALAEARAKPCACPGGVVDHLQSCGGRTRGNPISEEEFLAFVAAVDGQVVGVSAVTGATRSPRESSGGAEGRLEIRMSLYTREMCLRRASACATSDEWKRVIAEHEAVAASSADSERARIARGFAAIARRRRDEERWRVEAYRRLAEGEEVTGQ